MSEHSPTPWSMSPERSHGAYRLTDANGFTVFAFLSKELATRVLMAVNNHDKLVSILRLAYNAIMTGNDTDRSRVAEDIYITLGALKEVAK